METLFDASALFNLVLKTTDPEYFEGAYISSLTIYEIGNVIWKTHLRKLISKKEADALMETFMELSKFMRVFDLEYQVIKEALELGIKEGLSFYDSSYIVFARKFNCKLISDDKKILKVAPKYSVNAIKSEDIV